MHHVQSHILQVLARQEYGRFSEMRPPKVDTNLYSYHLKTAQRDGYLIKTDSGYTLTSKGLGYVDTFSFHTKKPRLQPKIISILAVQNPAGQWLLARRKYQPYIGKSMLPSGKQHFGESPEIHVERELKEKLALSLPLSRRGLADVRIYRDEVLITHITAHVYSGLHDNFELPSATDQFEYVWHMAVSPNSELLAGTAEIIDALQNQKELFFLSLDVSDR